MTFYQWKYTFAEELLVYYLKRPTIPNLIESRLLIPEVKYVYKGLTVTSASLVSLKQFILHSRCVLASRKPHISRATDEESQANRGFSAGVRVCYYLSPSFSFTRQSVLQNSSVLVICIAFIALFCAFQILCESLRCGLLSDDTFRSHISGYDVFVYTCSSFFLYFIFDFLVSIFFSSPFSFLRYFFPTLFLSFFICSFVCLFPSFTFLLLGFLCFFCVYLILILSVSTSVYRRHSLEYDALYFWRKTKNIVNRTPWCNGQSSCFAFLNPSGRFFV